MNRSVNRNDYRLTADATSETDSNHTEIEQETYEMNSSQSNTSKSLNGKNDVLNKHDSTLGSMFEKKKPTKKQKASHVQALLLVKPLDIVALRKLALIAHGYGSDEMRIKVWPLLLGVKISKKSVKISKNDLESHRDYNQVVLDVNRSLRRFPPAMPDKDRMVLQDQLITLIMKVLYFNSELHYYQGFHDICVTFLLLMGKDLSFFMVSALCNNHLRDFMDVDMTRTRNMLNYLYPILREADGELCGFMQRTEVGNIFCLSWLITWYGHVLDNPRHTVRLYDFFLASHPLMPIYLAAAIVIFRREEVLSEEPEMCFIHSLLSKVPNNLPIEDLIIQANTLFTLYPPSLMARRGKLEYKQSKALSNFASLEKSFGHSDARFTVISKADQLSTEEERSSLFLRYTVWTLTAAVGVALIASNYAVRDMW